MKLIYYADYEALEFDPKKSPIKIPSYLQNFDENILIPLVLTCCTKKGNLAHTQIATKNKCVSFFEMIDALVKSYNLFKIKIKKETDINIIEIYFHNLQYDFNIILWEMFSQGYTQFVDLTNENLIYKNLPIQPKKFFTVLGKDIKTCVGINFKYKGIMFQLRDTFKIISQSQDNILKSFNFPLKPEMDFKNFKYKRDIKKLVERCQYDTCSLSKCFETFFLNMCDTLGDVRSMTASSIALKYFKQELNLKDEINFRNFLPILDIEPRKMAKYGYCGGITSLGNNVKGFYENVQMVDINSSYPFAMTQDLPYGSPTKIFKEVKNGYSDYIIKVNFEIKNNMIPFLRVNSHQKACELLNISNNDFYKKSYFPKKFKGYLCINSIDLELLNKYYKCNYKIIFGYNYKTKKYLKEMIEKLYNYRTEFKKKGDKVKEQSVKLILNSLYGKFAQDLTGEIRIMEEINKTVKSYVEDNNNLYIPLSSCITSLGRKNLVNVINILDTDFLYCDTDSVYFKNVEKNYKILEDNNLIDDIVLGNWAKEYTEIKKAKFIGKKLYMIETDEKIVIKSVGLSKKYHRLINFDNFEIGSEFEIEKMVKINGGLAMKDTTYKIKERL
ncbi:MAG: DNA polymerase [Fusobacteriaceae bacterium]